MQQRVDCGAGGRREGAAGGRGGRAAWKALLWGAVPRARGKVSILVELSAAHAASNRGNMCIYPFVGGLLWQKRGAYGRPNPPHAAPTPSDRLHAAAGPTELPLGSVAGFGDTQRRNAAGARAPDARCLLVDEIAVDRPRHHQLQRLPVQPRHGLRLRGRAGRVCGRQRQDGRARLVSAPAGATAAASP